MRVHSPSRSMQEGLHRRALRLERLPLRPVTVRAMMTSVGEEPGGEEPESLDVSKSRAVSELDPGWVLGRLARGQEANPLDLMANGRWWPAAIASRARQRDSGSSLASLSRHFAGCAFVGS